MLRHGMEEPDYVRQCCCCRYSPLPRQSPRTGSDSHGKVDARFADEVWVKVGALERIKCHKQGGDAEDTRFVLRDPDLVKGEGPRKLMEGYHDAFARLTDIPPVVESGRWRLVAGSTIPSGRVLGFVLFGELIENDTGGFGVHEPLMCLDIFTDRHVIPKTNCDIDSASDHTLCFMG